jgi:hypothetical protein
MVMRYLGGINSPSYNPLAANVTTGANTVQQGGIYTTTSAAQANGLQQWVGDPYYGQTTTLLQADNFANGSQNNTFLDSSTNNFTVTRNGNPTQGTFTPYSAPNGYWSNFFDGTGDYLIVAGSSNLAFGTSDFTIECFFYANALQGFIYDGRNTGTQASPTIFFSGTQLIYYVSGANRITSGTVVIGRWYHLVVSRVSGSTRMFFDGVQTGSTYTDSTTYVNSTNRPYIGANGSGSISGYSGYITSLRVLNGTGTTAPVVPTNPLTAITNTQLLTCQNNRFIDNSANNFVITGVADASTRVYIPFNNNLLQYSKSLVGGSMYFDGTADYLTVADNAALELGSNDFCIEMLIYTTAVATDAILITKRASSTAFAPILIYRNSAAIRVGMSSNGSSWNMVDPTTTTLGTVTANQWFHISVYRVGTAIYGSFNGTITTLNANTSASALNNTDPYYIGSDSNLSPYVGYISNLRMVIGSSVYTSSSAPYPTAPLTAITNAQLLLSGTNAGISDSSATIVGETVGNAQVSTAIKKYGSGSMSFDGTGDWLLVPHSPDINLSTGDFTIECWINISNTTAARSIVSKGTGSTTGFELYINAAPTLLIFAFGGSITYSSNYNLNQNQWYHIAVVKAGTGIGNIKMFINGFLIFESATAITTDLSTTAPMYVGAGRTTGQPLIGYIDDLRITRGVARYTSPFIPPATALSRASQGNI